MFLRAGQTIAELAPTPGIVTVRKSKDDILIVCDKPGYMEASYLDPAHTAESFWMGVGPGWAVDSAAGTGNKYKGPVNITLTPALPPDLGADFVPSDPEANIITRFQALRALLEQGLITREEYNRHRAANLGALLPYSQPAPAADLGRSAPNGREVSGRLNFLKDAFADHSMTGEGQAAERQAILDALLPVAPVVRASPPPPIADQTMAAAQIDRVNRMAAAHLITAAEQAREREAIARQAAMSMAPMGAPMGASGVVAAPIPKPRAASGGAVGLRLGTYRSQEQAMAAWTALQQGHGGELSGLEPQVKRVTSRRHGTSYLLTAGPVAGQKAAQALCRSLSRQHQSCKPAAFGR